ncbi:MAG: YHS domain-containing protein [Rubritalea sp.]|jgi:YHS domain-containing protein
MKPKQILVVVLTILFTSCASSIPQPSKEELAAAKPYPLDICLVIDRPLSETKKTYTKIYKGQQVKFCCTNCIKAFDANPELFMHKLK